MDFITSIQQNPHQLLIPVIAGLIGWITNVLAVKMMFYPVEFIGIRPFLGWQGIIPANALALANRGLKLVTAQLLDVRELFLEFDPKSFMAGQEEGLRETTRKLVDEKANKHFPDMWSALGPEVHNQIYEMAYKEVTQVSSNVLSDAASNIHDLLHLGEIMTEALTSDKALMNRIFMRVGKEEFIFIERSGLYFGFLFGLVQFMVWMLYPAYWVLPLFGFLVGYVTNWVALKLVFEPQTPYKLGPITIHGLFHRRQQQIAVELSDIMTKKIISSENLYAGLASGESRSQLLELVKKHVQPLFDKLKGHPMAAPVLVNVNASELEAEIMQGVEQEMFREKGLIFAFADKADQIRDTFRSRMSAMEPKAFEGVLRPAFQQDEWKLLLAGAVLGLGAGIVQLVALFGELVLS